MLVRRVATGGGLLRAVPPPSCSGRMITKDFDQYRFSHKDLSDLCRILFPLRAHQCDRQTGGTRDTWTRATLYSICIGEPHPPEAEAEASLSLSIKVQLCFGEIKYHEINQGLQLSNNGDIRDSVLRWKYWEGRVPLSLEQLSNRRKSYTVNSNITVFVCVSQRSTVTRGISMKGRV